MFSSADYPSRLLTFSQNTDSWDGLPFRFQMYDFTLGDSETGCMSWTPAKKKKKKEYQLTVKPINLRMPANLLESQSLLLLLQ